MLPDSKNSPTGLPKTAGLPLVPVLVLGEFGQPILLIRFGIRRVLWAAVPEASIDKDSDSLGRKDDVDIDPFDAAMKAEA